VTEGARTADVAIVGGGPVGLVLAIELGRLGVRAVLFNDRPGTTPYAAANATQARTMEHFRRLGFADRVRALGLPADYPTDIAYYTRYARHELARFSLPSARDARALVRSLSGSWSAAELPHRCSQRFIEPVLFGEASRHASVELAFGWRVVDWTESADAVTVRAADAAGRERPLRARWLVGCDGARSAVRRRLGIDMAGETGVQRDFMGGRMHAMYFRAPQLYRRIAGPPAWMYWAFNAERRGFMAAIDGREEFVFHMQMRPGEDADALDEATAQRMFAQALGATCELEVLSRSSWIAGHSLVAQRMRAGRVFLAGDAAHLFTPTGGLGYNTGVEDAVNLGWKLAAVARGEAQESLLDSYEAERRPLALRNTAFARGFADSIGLYRPAPGLEDDSPDGAALRADAGAYLERHARTEFNIPGVTFGGRYDGSPLIADDAEAPPADAANAYQPTSVPGGRAPHLWLDDGASLYDRFGAGFTLLDTGESAAADAQVLGRALARASLPVRLLSLPYPRLRDLYPRRFTLVRPDQVVAWRGDVLPGGPARLLERAMHWRAAAPS
jgi:2-polyprenyl-6-methoxyphenol hydroxylase-like FAD-dependent oxidoreductase